MRLLLILTLLLSGCGLTVQQKADTSRIARATTAAGDFSTTQLVALRSSMISLQAAYYKIDPEATCKKTSVGTCIIPLDRGVSAKDIEERIALSQALSAYGNALYALVNDDHSEDILEAANDLSDALGDAAEKSGSLALSQDHFDAISALTGLAGRWHVGRKRKKALQTLATDYANTVKKVTPLLERDFTLSWNSPCLDTYRDGRATNAPRSGHSKEVGALDKYCRAAYDLKRFALELIKDPHQEHVVRAAAVDGYMLADNAQTNGALLSREGVALLQQLNESASELEEVAKNKKYKSRDIKQLGKDVKTLATSLKLLINADQGALK